MRILIVEDNPERIKSFKRALIGHDLTVADNHDAAVLALSSQRFDAVFFDHDLGDHGKPQYGTSNMYGAPTLLDGADVARALASLPPQQHPRLAIIHSFNPDGVKDILVQLRNTTVAVQLVLKFNPDIEWAKVVEQYD